MDGGAVGLVVGRLEYIGNAKSVAHLDIVLGHPQGEITTLQHIHAAQQDERGSVADAQFSNRNSLVSHGLYSLSVYLVNGLAPCVGDGRFYETGE